MSAISLFLLPLDFASSQKGYLPALPLIPIQNKEHFCAYMHVSLTAKKTHAMPWTTNCFIFLVSLKLSLKRKRKDFLSQTMLCNKTVLACRFHLVSMNKTDIANIPRKPPSLS